MEAFRRRNLPLSAAIDNHRLTLHDAWTVSPHFVNELQGSFSRSSQYFPLSGVAQTYPSIFIEDLSGILIGPSTAPSLPESSVFNEYLLGDTATWIVKQRHTLKFGGQFYWFTSPLNAFESAARRVRLYHAEFHD